MKRFLVRFGGDVGAVIALLVASLWTLRSFFLPGLFYAHDSIYHFARLYQFYQELLSGQFPVRMATQFVYGFGYPIFNFVYTMPYYLGSIGIALGLSYVDSLKMVAILSSLVSLLIWYVWLRGHFTVLPSLLGSLLFWFFPYRFLTLFVTFQLGTIVAGAFLPVMLIGIDLLILAKNHQSNAFRNGFLLTVLGGAGLMLSHLVTGIVFAPFICCYLVYCSWKKLSLVKAKKEELQSQLITLATVGFAIVGLTAFYWLPATVELPLVRAGQQAIVEYSDHFPTFIQLLKSPWGYGYSDISTNDGMSFQVGYAQWLVWGIATLMLMWSLFKEKNVWAVMQKNGLAIVGIISFIVYMFLLLPISDFVWQYLPMVATVQHPWRFLAGIGASSALLLASLAARSKWGRSLAILLVILAVLNTRNYYRPMTFDYMSEDNLINRIETVQSGDVSWEFMPTWATHATFTPTPLVFSWAGTSESIESADKLILSNTVETELVLSKIYYPSWEVYDNSVKVQSYQNVGLLTVLLPPGTHHIEVVLGQTLVARVGNMITVVTLVVLIVGLFGKKIFRSLQNFKMKLSRLQ